MWFLWLQWCLEDELGGQFLDLFLYDIVIIFIFGGYNKCVEQLVCDFCIFDKRFWWLKLIVLVDLEDWEELEKFFKSKKLFIGYLFFVEICMK